MPKNSWKILKSAITKDNIGRQSGKEYVNLQHPIEDLLRCYGLDLCNYVPPGGMEWLQGGNQPVDFTAEVGYVYTVNSANLVITPPATPTLGDSFAIVSTVPDAVVGVDDAGVLTQIELSSFSVFTWNGTIWNQTANNALTMLYKGAFDALGTVYKYGDVVIDGTDTFVYINQDASTGNLTSDTLYWTKIGSTASGSATYINTSFTSQTSVTVTHNIGHFPLVQVADNTGNVFIPLSIIHNSINDFTITFSSSTTGNILTFG